MGDLGDLAELAQWAGAGLGAGFVQINPAHLWIEAVPECAHLDAEQRARAEE